jgi:3-dehydroquinate dehydratase-2
METRDTPSLLPNYEGRLVTAIQKSKGVFDAIIINAAAYTHTSIAILDALKAANLPAVEVHLSNLILREDFRAFSYIALYTDKTIMGKGFEGYNEALDYLFDRYGHL